MTGRILYLDQLTQECGYFNPRANVNNGYGCRHPRQEDVEDGEGRCFTFSCPIASQLDPSSNDPGQADGDAELLRSAGWDDDEIAGVSEESQLMHVWDADDLGRPKSWSELRRARRSRRRALIRFATAGRGTTR